MIEIPEDLFHRITNLLRVLSSACKECARPKSSCSECDISPAPYLLSRMNDIMNPNSRTNKVDYGRRFDVIEEEIRKAGRPLLAKEIDPQRKLCGRGLKYWSLRKMVKLGMLKSFKKDGQIYFVTKD